MNNAAEPHTDTQIQVCGPLGLLTLHRSQTLNALTLDMIRELAEGLRTLEANNAVAMIIIRSADPRAFCAGGDMKQIRRHVLAGEHDAIESYFRHEYALDLAIARCRKPFLALIDGVAMGGGLGISVNGRFRVVTDKARLAMPETRIGFFPDVGASWFLPRLPQRSGYWFALSAVSVSGIEARMLGLATHYVSSESFQGLEDSLANALSGYPAGDTDGAARIVEQVLDDASLPLDKERKSLIAQRLSQREQWFIDDDLNSIRRRLQADTDCHSDAAELLGQINSASPWSLHHTIKLFQMTQDLELEDCLERELQLAIAACRHPDLVEGVRAVLVDKDRKPKWASLATLE